MLLRIIRFFRGWVTFRITGRFPERFINVALKNGMGIFNVVPGDGFLYASAVLSDYRLVRPVARKARVRLRVIKRHGLPFIIGRYRHRWGIAVGIIMFIVLTLVLQNFVWTVQISGVETLSKTEILNFLEESGFHVGSFKGNLDLHKIERSLQLEFEKIGWMSINLIGTHAQVEIKEKASVPESEYSADFSNIKAARDGIIKSTNVKRGTAEVAVGSAVSEGQLLVSGMYENTTGELHFVDADAEILAETQYSFTATCDENVRMLVPEVTTERSVAELFTCDIPISFSPQQTPYTSYIESSQLYLNGTPVPFTLHTQHLLSYNTETISLTPETAEAKLKADLAMFMLFGLNDVNSMTIDTEFSKINGGYSLTSEIICTEDIALKENFVVNSQ